MKRLVLLLFTAIVVTLPPSLILVMIGGIATAGLSSGALMRITSASAAATIPGVMMLTVTATTISKSPSPLLKLPLAAVMTTSWAMMASPGSLSSASVMAYELGGVVVNDAPMTADSETFKVSVLGQSKGGSPTCTFSLVEFTNTHPRDDIIIHSAHIEPSVVFPSGHAIFNEASSNSELPPAPPDVEYPFDRTLHLRPGTVTTVPVSIYPHWRRSFDNGSNRLQHSSTAVSGQPASIYHMSTHRNESSVILDSNSESIRADLADILKNSQDYMFMSSAGITLSPDRQIHETLVANTSWGFLQMKAPYLCIPNSRELKFGLAHNVMFIDGGGGWYAPPTSFRTTCDNLDPFVYHVFMNNPSAKSSIRIWEVFTTQPEFVRVEYHSYRPQCRAEDTFISNELEGISTRIPPGATNFYVSTIRLLPENFNSTMFSSYIDLGFLELRTSVSHFTVGLSFIPNKGKKNIVHGLVNSTTVGHVHLAKSKAMEVAASRILREKQIKGNSSTQMGVIKSYRSSGATPVASTQQLSNQLDKDQHIASINPNGLGNEPPSISTSPVNINFGIITSGSRMSRVPVNIINNFGHAVRVMRISVTLKTVMEEGVLVNDIINETHKFDVGVDFIGKQVYHLSSTRGDDKESFQIGGDVVIPPHSILKRPITVRSMFNPSLEHLVLPRSYTGSIIIWVTGDLNATYLEWEQQLISHKSFGSEYITEVPFEAAILPGNFEISTDTVLFPSHFSMLSKEERARTKLRTNAKSPETFDRELEITNNFAVPVSVTKIQIADTGKDDDLCHKYFSTPLFDSLTEAQQPKADRKESLKGVSVRFHFPSDENIGPFPKKCMLSLDTDRVGRQNLPLIIYSGELIGDLDLPDGRRVNKDCMRTVNNSPTTSSGMPCIHDWVERSIAGKILSDAILHMQQTRSRQMTWPQLCVEKSHDPLESYFLQLFPADHGKIHSLQPIVIPVGSVNAGDVVTRSVFLTNLNHVPVEVTTSSAAFENVNIAIGVTQASLQSLIMKMKNKGKHDIAYFLAESPVAKDILSNLTASVDIALSSRADGSELPSLFARHHIVQTFDDSTNFLDETMAEDRHGIMKCSCGFLLSTDGSTHVETSTKMISSNKWSIPPGGIARYSIQIRVPDKISLRSDITSFVQTGLMLQTNYGQAMPIILTYSALVGKLQLIPAREMMETNFSLGDDNFDNQNNQLEHVDVEVPMRIRDSSPAGATFEHEGIPLQIESTFSHDLYLSEVRSCNKWFRVKVSPENIKNWPLSNHNITGYHDLNVSKVVVIKAGNVSRSSSYRPAVVPIGFVHSMMSCPKFVKSKSFFSCALEWLEKRDTIQPHGCGNRVDDLLKESFEVGKMKEIQSRTISILRNVVDYLSHRYGGNTAGKSEIDNFGEVNSRKYVPYSFIELVQSAWTAWRDIESIGLNIVTGHVTATTMYISNDKIESQQKNQHSPLTIPVSSVLLKSTLSIPRLFQGRRESSVGVVEFDSTRISETTIRFVPVVNPTDSTIHVRLSAALGADDSTFKSVHVQNSASESHPWWTGGSYWMSDFDGHLISASHNVTIKSGGGAFVSLINPSLHSMSAFVLGCGMRCGLQNGADSDAQDKLYSTIGSASGENMTLIGRHHVSIPMPKYSQSPVDVLGMSDPPSFALGRISTEEVIIPPYGSAKLGPVFFRPPSRGIFSSSIFLENSLNGYEEVKIVGRGMWEKIVFLDSEVSGGGGDIEFRFGRSALVFPGSATTLEGLPVVKSVVVANLGDIPVNISNIRMTSSETMHFSRRKPPPALFRYNSISSIIRRVRNSAKSSRDCSHRGFNIVGCVESSFNSWSEKWFYWLNEMKKLLSFVPTRTVERLDQNGFTLNPNENTTLFIEHRPDCTFQTLYTSLILEVNDGNRPPNKRRSPTFSDETFRDEKLELLVGYDMSAYEMKHCVPYSPPRTRAWDKTFIVPSIVQDIGSFGLTRWTDANGNPIIPMRPIEMSYLSAFFLFILFLLAFDLMIELDSQSDNRKKCTNWKSTSRCLARADPTSSDLIALGKEQTKHVLLSRLKKDGVLPSQCVQSDGSFTRERFGSYITSAPPKPSDVNNASTPMRRVTLANQQARTLSDALFSQHNLMKSANKTTEWESESERAVSLPCGLKWRIALRRGIAFCQSRINDDTDSSPVRRYLKRYRDRRVKKNIEKQSSTPRQYAPVNTTQHDVSLVAKRHDAHVNVETIDRVSNDEGNHHLVKEEPKSTNGNIHSVPSKNNHVGHPLKDVETNNNSKSHSETKVALARDESAKVLNENYSVNSQQTRVRVGKVELSPTQLKHKPLKDAKQLKEDRTISSKSEKKKEVPKGDGSSASSKTKTLKKNSFQNTAVGQKTTSARTNNGKHELQSRNHPSTPSQQVVIASHEVKNSRHVKTPKDETKSSESKRGSQRKQGRSKAKRTSLPELPAANMNSKTQEPTPREVSTKKSDHPLIVTQLPEADFPPLSSIPSSPKNEATSEGTTTHSRQPDVPTPPSPKATLRPPPGLLPPPGFSYDETNTPPILSPLNSTSHHTSPVKMTQLSDRVHGHDISESSFFDLHQRELSQSPPLLQGLLFGARDDDESFPIEHSSNNSIQDTPVRTISDNSIRFSGLRPPSLTPPVLESLSTETHDDVHTLLGANSDFNVTSFLDGLLSDSTQTERSTDNMIDTPALSAEPLIHFNASAVPLDPWNSSSESSRNNPLAAVIGKISNAESMEDEYNQETVIAGIPLKTSTPSLLTPSAFQNVGSFAEPAYASLVSERNDEDDTDSFLEPDSFYNQLLGED